MDKEFATYSRHYKDTAEGHIFLQKRGACTITLEGAMAMSQKELDKFAENIETGQAPYDQQQTLTLEFYKDRIAALELEVKEIRKDMMQMVHDMNGMKPPSHSGH